MADAVRTYCKEKLPLSVVCAVVYLSLADEYNRTVKQIEKLCGVEFDCIHIIGGGSKDELLNSLTAKICNKKVVAGPTEATAIGNILAQMISKGELSGVKEARECVMKSFSVVEYE
jgi:rhamnulokinase